VKQLTVLTLLLACSLALSAQPQGPRHINFTQAIVGLDGKPVQAGEGKTSTPFTLSDASVNALLASLPEDGKLSGVDKYNYAELARKIYQNKDVILTVEEIATIKDRIGKAYGPLIVGSAWRLLDPQK
jgi:hypothetical protein